MIQRKNGVPLRKLIKQTEINLSSSISSVGFIFINSYVDR